MEAAAEEVQPPAAVHKASYASPRQAAVGSPPGDGSEFLSVGIITSDAVLPKPLAKDNTADAVPLVPPPEAGGACPSTPQQQHGVGGLDPDPVPPAVSRRLPKSARRADSGFATATGAAVSVDASKRQAAAAMLGGGGAEGNRDAMGAGDDDEVTHEVGSDAEFAAPSRRRRIDSISARRVAAAASLAEAAASAATGPDETQGIRGIVTAGPPLDTGGCGRGAGGGALGTNALTLKRRRFSAPLVVGNRGDSLSQPKQQAAAARGGGRGVPLRGSADGGMRPRVKLREAFAAAAAEKKSPEASRGGGASRSGEGAGASTPLRDGLPPIGGAAPPLLCASPPLRDAPPPLPSAAAPDEEMASRHDNEAGILSALAATVTNVDGNSASAVSNSDASSWMQRVLGIDPGSALDLCFDDPHPPPHPPLAPALNAPPMQSAAAVGTEVVSAAGSVTVHPPAIEVDAAVGAAGEEAATVPTARRGWREAYTQLIASGADVSEAWVSNHYRWVVWKLASYFRLLSLNAEGQQSASDAAIVRSGEEQVDGEGEDPLPTPLLPQQPPCRESAEEAAVLPQARQGACDTGPSSADDSRRAAGPLRGPSSAVPKLCWQEVVRQLRRRQVWKLQ